MKIFLVLLTFFSVSSFGQVQSKNTSPVQKISKIFNEYIKYEDGIDSKENTAIIKAALGELETKCTPDDLPVLLNVWMYYDPTDFPTRDLVMKVLLKNKTATRKAIDDRLKHKRKRENTDTAPYSDLISLRSRFP